MRRLTLKRKKTFVASVAKVRIFLEDINGTLNLGGVPCKEIGTLKNGATGEFDIPDEKVYLFVVFSKVAPDSYHFAYQIPAGTENIELFTSPALNPLRGNPFEIYSRDDLIALGKADGW